MSVRVYTGPHASRRSTSPGPLLMSVPWLFAIVTVLGQIWWVLADADGRRLLTVATVLTFFLASSTHALLTRGVAWTLGYLAVTLVLGWAAEAVGTSTGLPFGDYAYSDALGPTVGGVPFVIPLAWAMMAYPCLLAARALTRSAVLTPLVGMWLLATWDLFLDPQMVGEGYWTWASPEPALPGIPGIPAQNYLGWLLVALAIMALLDRLPRRPGPDGVPALLLLWTYVGGIVANAVFLGRPWVAVWGGVAMGIAVLPWLWRTWVERP